MMGPLAQASLEELILNTFIIKFKQCQTLKSYSISQFLSSQVSCTQASSYSSQFSQNTATSVLGLYYFLFLIYTLKTYSVFHYPPSQPNYHSVKFDATLIFKYKLVQERRAEVQYQLAQAKKNKLQLIEQYTKLLKSASFCDVCQKVQPPRSYHCYLCDVCIIKKHFHSKAIGFCIGQNNQIPYLLYLLISKYISLYGFVSLIVNQLTNTKSFEKLQSSAQIVFFILILTFFATFLYYFKTSVSFLSHLQSNISFVESKNPYLPKNISLYENGNKRGLITYRGCLLQLFRCKQMGDVSYWASQAEQLSDQM